MAQRFRGEDHHKVDAKGRVSIPALFRRVLEADDPAWQPGLRPQLVIVYGNEDQKFLECYTINAINDVDDRIFALPRGSVKRRILEDHFHGHSHPTEVNDDGRLVLPQKMRDQIGLENEAFFISSGDTFKIWKPENYKLLGQAGTREFLDQQPEGFDPLTLLDQAQGE